jgi:hypothetical protein
MRIFVAAAAIAALAGCSKKSEPPQPGSRGPESTADADALWALAPAGARGGLVASPRAVTMAEHAVADLRAMLTGAADLAEWRQSLEELLATEVGISSASLAELGLTGAKGLALFLVRDGMVAILPVADRAAFLARANGSAGGGVDRIGGYACKEVRGVYACATAEPLLDTLGKGDLAARLAPIHARGDLELVGLELPLGGTAPGELTAVVQLERGAAVIRGALRGVAPALAARFVGAYTPRADQRTAGFALADLPALVGTAPETPFGGTTLAAVARSLRGALTIAVPAGHLAIDARQGLSDPAPMRALVDSCPALTESLGIAATVDAGTCHMTLPIGDLRLDAWVETDALRIGQRGAPLTGAPVPMTPMGAELARGPWAHAFWGRGTLLHGSSLPVAPPGAQLSPASIISLRSLSLLSELGAGVRRDGDALVFVATARTVFANPDDIVAKLLAITAEDIAAGRAGPAAKQIADAAPAAPFAADDAAGEGGLIIPTTMLNAAMKLVVPALLRRGR